MLCFQPTNVVLIIKQKTNGETICQNKHGFTGLNNSDTSETMEKLMEISVTTAFREYKSYYSEVNCTDRRNYGSLKVKNVFNTLQSGVLAC